MQHYRHAMKPLLAHQYNPSKLSFPCYVQPKLNGIRALYQNGNFQSRDEVPFPDGLLAHIAETLMPKLDPRIILDGELYVHGWPLQRINAAVTPVRQKPTGDTLLVRYHVFDIVNFYMPFSARCSLLQDFALQLHPTPVRIVHTPKVHSELEADQYYSRYVTDGYEGMMYRLNGCPYTQPKAPVGDYPFYSGPRPRSGFLSDRNNRAWHLLKRKNWLDEEFECVGVEEGEGKRIGMVGAFVCKSNINGKLFRVGSFAGFHDHNLISLFHTPPLGKQLKVKYLCLSTDGVPLNPTLLAIL
jgi:ATP-dependent DNA ligase